MSRPIVLVALLAGVGTTLVLSGLRWFSRRPLGARLLPYVPGGWKRPPRLGVLSVGTFREVVRPLATAVGDLVGQVFGVRDDLPTRLARIHSPLDAAALRVRQLGWAGGVFVAAAALVLLAGPPTVLGALAGALERISRRGSGACARDLQRVGRRIRQGLSEAEALEEWAELADVPALHRLVGVLSLNRDTGDLGRLIAEEARAVRREVHRQLITQIDRRAQQVWIPVTVATLVPGTLFLAVPFLQAMRLFGS